MQVLVKTGLAGFSAVVNIWTVDDDDDDDEIAYFTVRWKTRKLL